MAPQLAKDTDQFNGLSNVGRRADAGADEAGGLVAEASSDRTRTILVVDGDHASCDTLGYALRHEGFRVLVASDGRRVVDVASQGQIDLIISEVHLPGLSGFDLCRAVREHLDIPILMLSDNDEEVVKVVCLELGADDYVMKPFSRRELVARVRALLRRSPVVHRDMDAQALAAHARSAQLSGSVRLVSGDLEINLAARTVKLAGEPIHLTRTQYSVLVFLVEHAGEVFTQEQLLAAAWGPHRKAHVTSVRVILSQVRKKLERDTGQPKLVETVTGYRFACPVVVESAS